jgi:hypothetical protein
MPSAPALRLSSGQSLALFAGADAGILAPPSTNAERKRKHEPVDGLDFSTCQVPLNVTSDLAFDSQDIPSLRSQEQRALGCRGIAASTKFL